jgi:purine-binding chemotaxis protein CheW
MTGGRPIMSAKETVEEPAVVVEEPSIAEETIQVVVFTLAGEEYGVEILEVRRIIKAEAITMIPTAPDFLSGVINLRSQIIGVIDLEKRFLLKRGEEYDSKHILIVEIGNSTYGLLVDEVTEILRLPTENIKPAPQIITKKLGAEFVKGIGTVGEKLVILLDLEKVLSEKELVELSKISAKAYRTIEAKKKEKKTTEQTVSEETLPKEKRTTKHETPKEKLMEKPTR